MKLDLVLGASGSGKTAEILRRVKLLLENRKILTGKVEEKIIVLVPDQYTVSTERFYLEKIGEEAMPFIKILSMKRLASFIFTFAVDFIVPVSLSYTLTSLLARL